MSTDKTLKPLNIFINGERVKQVQTFDYLGYRLSFDGDDSAAIKHRIGLGWDAFNKNKMLLTSKRIPLKIKTKIYRTYVMPVVLYGLDCSTWKAKSLQALEVFQNHIMRFMTSHTLLDKIKIDTLRELTNLRPITSYLKERKLKLFGHIKRSSYGLAKICVEGTVLGSRSRGRPKQRWFDDVKSWTNCCNISDLNNMVKDRTTWRGVCHRVMHSAS